VRPENNNKKRKRRRRRKEKRRGGEGREGIYQGLQCARCPTKTCSHLYSPQRCCKVGPSPIFTDEKIQAQRDYITAY